MTPEPCAIYSQLSPGMVCPGRVHKETYGNPQTEDIREASAD